MLVTVFTPTYNRATTLVPLFKSLKGQTNQGFEWIIIDDGSTDETESVCIKIEKESPFSFRYYKQENGGKHRAINKGLVLAKGELFFIVDSDDILPPNAIERIIFHYYSIGDDSTFAGVCGLRASFSRQPISKGIDFNTLDCTSIEIRSKYHVRGDMAEVYKTAIMKQFPFPEFEGEKFCPEALVHNRIALQYRLRYFSEITYLCEYRKDGLTASIDIIRMKSPRSTCLCYYEYLHCPIPISQKIRYAINYWRFYFCLIDKKPFMHSLGWAYCLIPVGFIYHFYDILRYKR